MSAKRYVKKPVVIEAIKWDGKNIEKVQAFCSGCFIAGGTLAIATLEGMMSANVGDFIIRGVKGEFYPCKPAIFAMTYEEVGS